MSRVQDAADRFCRAAIGKGDIASSTARDHEFHRIMGDACRVLDEEGVPGKDAFRRLLTDESPHVRKWVAAELLARGERSARLVLEELADTSSRRGGVGIGLSGMSAPSKGIECSTVSMYSTNNALILRRVDMPLRKQAECVQPF